MRKPKSKQFQSSNSTHELPADIAAAFDYAARGWPVFQCHGVILPGWGIKVIACTCSLGAACDPKSKGKHPATHHGFHDATIDPNLIAHFRYGRNLAIATGNGLMIADVDPRHGGGKTMAALERQHGKLARDAVVLTGGGGAHLYCTYPPKITLASGNNVFGEGVDLKADGGYVIAPPSLHASGNRYRWLKGEMPREIPPAPKWLLEMAIKGAPQGLRRSPSSRAGKKGEIKTKDHPQGLAIAALLGARDNGHYWSIVCPAGDHETPDAAMYPRENGEVFFKCFSGSACTHDQIVKAVGALAGEGADED